MARRSDHSREELEALAINAGHQLIGEQGFSHFSARQVALRIGYTVGTLYHIFGSYDELILRINAKTLDAWYGEMAAALQKNKSDPMRFLARHYLAYSTEHYQHWLALFEHHMEKGRAVPGWYREKLARFFVLMEDALLPRVGNNRKKAGKIAKVLWAGIHGICILSHTGKLDIVGAQSAEALALSLVDHYLAGVKHA